jgi:hypothetical protein
MAYPSLTAYRDVPMKVLKGDYRCTLYVGLWRPELTPSSKVDD